ncbi:MAG TPA: hypothetical protein VND99_04265 [Candidatus Acidoferrales bacterium]|nr:hypothetical protein [Candidatus Acidoferrales bacterium]
MFSAKNRNYFFLILLIGIIVYFPIFFNGFVWDDIAFILLNPQVHTFNLVTAFGPNIFNTIPFYRPIPATYFALLYAIFGQNAFFYHFLQLLLHCIDAYLVFVLFRLFFGKRTSFILSLLFLAHPINVESVAFISSIASELSLFFALTAFLLSTAKHLSSKRLFGIALLLMLGIMTKETGALVFLLILTYRYLYKVNKLKTFIVIGGGVILIYSLLRVINSLSFNNIYSWVPIANVSLPLRILNIPAIIIYYLQTVIFPLKLSIYQIWVVTSVASINFLVPFFICLLLGAGVLIVLFKMKKQHSAYYTAFVFFFVWYLINLLPILQIIPLEMTVADRWFYVPLIGVLGMLGVLAVTVKINKRYLSIGAIIIIIVLSLRTFVRTFDWHDDVMINMHDLADQKDNYIIMDDLAMALFREGDTTDALRYDKQSIALSPQIVTIGHLANIYYAQKQFGPATNEYQKAITLIGPDETEQYAGDLQQYYINLAAIQLRTGHPHAAVTILADQALKKLPTSHTLSILLAYAYYKANDHQKAIDAAAQAYRIYPDQQYAIFYSRLQQNLPVNINLGQ